jgi:hypothetical protein
VARRRRDRKREHQLAALLTVVLAAAASSDRKRIYSRPMTLAELGDVLGIDPGDLAVLVTALGERAGEELTPIQTPDLLDVLDAKTRPLATHGA